MGYEKTTFGRQALQTREIHLSPCQRAIFIMANGDRPLAELVKTALSMGGGQSDIDQLVVLGMLEFAGSAASDTAPAFFEPVDIGVGSGWGETDTQKLPSVAIAIEPVVIAPAVPFAMPSGAEQLAQARGFLLETIAPLGLRQTHLRRALEDADSVSELRELLPMVEQTTQGKPSPAFSKAVVLLS